MSHDCVKRVDHYCIETERCWCATQSHDKKKFNDLINIITRSMKEVMPMKTKIIHRGDIARENIH